MMASMSSASARAARAAAFFSVLVSGDDTGLVPGPRAQPSPTSSIYLAQRSDDPITLDAIAGLGKTDEPLISAMPQKQSTETKGPNLPDEPVYLVRKGLAGMLVMQTRVVDDIPLEECFDADWGTWCKGSTCCPASSGELSELTVSSTGPDESAVPVAHFPESSPTAMDRPETVTSPPPLPPPPPPPGLPEVWPFRSEVRSLPDGPVIPFQAPQTPVTNFRPNLSEIPTAHFRPGVSEIPAAYFPPRASELSSRFRPGLSDIPMAQFRTNMAEIPAPPGLSEIPTVHFKPSRTDGPGNSRAEVAAVSAAQFRNDFQETSETPVMQTRPAIETHQDYRPEVSEIPVNHFSGAAFKQERDQAQLGSLAAPTIGSVNHAHGTCKPCAFVFKDGCQNGVHCKFCHLCGPGEKQRRKKIKRAILSRYGCARDERTA